MNIKETAEQYVPPTTRNIVELKEVPVNMEIKEKTAMKNDGETFSYKYIEVANVEYRVPVSVIKSLKAILEKKPEVNMFSVTKSGEGLNTQYTVIPQ